MDIRSYDSLEEMQAAMRQAEDAANQRVTDQQRRITFGDHWMRPMGPQYDYVWIFGRVQPIDEYMTSELLGVTEFGGEDHYRKIRQKARSLIVGAEAGDELTAAMRGEIDARPIIERIRLHAEGVDLGLEGIGMQPPHADDWDEFADHVAMTAGSFARGYRFGKCYSPIEPTGEYGSTHISEMVPSTADEFASARAAGWQFGDLMTPGGPFAAEWAVRMAATTSSIDQLHRREVPRT